MVTICCWGCWDGTGGGGGAILIKKVQLGKKKIFFRNKSNQSLQ